MDLGKLIEENKNLIRVIIQSDDKSKIRDWIKGVLMGAASSRFNIRGLMYMKDEELFVPAEYEILKRFVDAGILSEEKISRNGTLIYSLFTTTGKGKEYLK
ncbi:hypothetical protein HYV49_00315 [Candidatus Pacearchaeota archaeon]|nr:hypothetical protein [Candidatus Pacearchaeota archaeon]